ncbi:MAG: phosphate-starvation-inducible PsiE family protein [Thermodesulfovibrionales bacterium]|jgi:uncharacterized membrane protein (DUF373 family)
MRIFKQVVDIIIKLMIPLVILTLLIGMARLILSLSDVFTSHEISTGFDTMVTGILSLFVVVELLKSIIEYFEANRLKLTFITDAGIVFIIREIMVGIYRHTMSPPEMAALALVLLVIGGLRTVAIIFSPDRTKEAQYEQ